MFKDLFCEKEQKRAVSCKLLMREQIHIIYQNYKFDDLIQPKKIEDNIYDLLYYSKLKFNMIVDDPEDLFQQIEQLDVFCTLAKQLDEEMKSTYDFIYEIAILDNQNVIQQINNYKNRLFTMHEQAKVNSIKTQNNNINNKEALQFIQYLKQQVKDKLVLKI